MYSKIHTYRECRDNVLKMLERYSSDGIQNDCGEMKDIEKRLPSSINIHMRKLYAQFLRSKKTSTVILSPPSKKYDFGSFEISNFDSVSKEIRGNGLACHAELSGNGEVIIVTEKTTEKYYFATAPGETEIFSAAIDVPKGTAAVILIGADPNAVLKVLSFVIYENFYGAGEYGELICADGKCCAKLPDDCAEVLAIYDKDGKAAKLSLFEFSERGNVVTAKSEMAGVYTLEYIAYPAELPENCRDDSEIILPPILFDALCYMCAADLCPAFDGEVYSKLTYKYREILENYYDRKPYYTKTRNSFYKICGRIEIPKRKGER